MTDTSIELASLIAFLVLFLGVGLWSARRGRGDRTDYLLAGQSVPAPLVALSAAATKYSGYMFVGLMGYIYLHGLSAIWLACGFLFGDIIVFSFVHKRLRQAAADTGALGFAELLSRWNGGEYKLLRLAVALVGLLFMATYAAAQLEAGGKALTAMLGWPTALGSILGGGVILAYCLGGGLRASIWTDAAQSALMMGAMVLLLVLMVSAQGGLGPLATNLEAVAPGYMDWGQDRFGSHEAALLFAVGWLFNGIGVTGQPQVMVRFMALDRPENMVRTGLWYFSWSGLFLAVTFAVGLGARLFLSGEGGFDAELALPTLAGHLLPGLGVGVVVGGIFAASLSTADSQVMACAAILGEDFRLARSVRAERVATLVVVLATLGIALFASDSVFQLVIVSWSAMACSLGPLVIVHALGQRPRQGTALAMMALGLGVALWWRHMGYGAQVYEGLPGILSALALFVLVDRLWRWRPGDRTEG